MMQTYFVKQDLYGLKAGRVERFADYRAGALMKEGAIEPFDPKKEKHSSAHRAQEKADEERRLAQERKLVEEFRRRGVPVPEDELRRRGLAR